MNSYPESDDALSPERIERIKSKLEFVLTEVCSGSVNTTHKYGYYNQDSGLFITLEPADVPNRMLLQIQYLVDFSEYEEEGFQRDPIENYMLDFNIKPQTP